MSNELRDKLLRIAAEEWDENPSGEMLLCGILAVTDFLYQPEVEALLAFASTLESDHNEAQGGDLSETVETARRTVATGAAHRQNAVESNSAGALRKEAVRSADSLSRPEQTASSQLGALGDRDVGAGKSAAPAEPSEELTREEIENRKRNAQYLLGRYPDTLEGEDAGRDVALCDMALRSLDFQEALAQAQREIELAFQMLEVYGVPRQRARYIHNGIDVLGTRYAREAQAVESDLARTKAELQERTRERDTLMLALRQIEAATLPDPYDERDLDLSWFHNRAMKICRAVLKEKP